VAHISRPRGFNGELAVIPYKADTKSLAKGQTVTLQKGDNSADFSIESVRVFKGRLGLKLAGIENEESALAWRDGEILVEAENLSTLNKDEYYHFDIEGSEVYEENGDYLGKVSAIDYMSANDVLTVVGGKGEILIPFIKSVVISVNTDAKKIIIRKIEGLY